MKAVSGAALAAVRFERPEGLSFHARIKVQHKVEGNARDRHRRGAHKAPLAQSRPIHPLRLLRILAGISRK